MSNAEMEKPDTRGESPLSLQRLTTAFAAMLGRKPKSVAAASDDVPREVEVSTRTITEAILLVGRPDNRPMSAEVLAAAMRGVSPAEVAAAVAELNAEYDEDGSPYAIAESAAGYRLMLREEFDRVREKFYGKIRQGTLSPPAMEVLSVIAYRQPVTAAAIDELRGQKSQSLVRQLVRRGLIRLEPGGESRPSHYVTTERFLQVFKLSSIDQLPQAEEFDMAVPAAETSDRAA